MSALNVIEAISEAAAISKGYTDDREEAIRDDMPSSSGSSGGSSTTTGGYVKPSTGIPKTDLAQSVQTSLGKADTALQESDVSALRQSVSSQSGKIGNLESGKFGYAELSGSTLKLYDKQGGTLLKSITLPSTSADGTVADGNTTYTFSISGHTLTITPSDGSPQTLTIPTDWTETQIRSLITGYGYALSTHNHDGVYQPVGSYASASHNHDSAYQAKGSYASASHNHDASYAQKEHTHTQYLTEHLTDSEIGAMGYTKNAGTYSKPSTGIPESDLSDAVKTKLNNTGSGGTGTAIDPLSGKKIICIGDSICEGVGTTDGNHSYVYYLAQNHTSATFVNLGVGGMTIAKKDETVTNCMPDRIQSGEFTTHSDADIILFEGGINDMQRNGILGWVKPGVSSYSKYSKFCDALDYIFHYFRNLCPNARIIYTSIHRLSTMDDDKQRLWWEAASEVCMKWDVEFIQLHTLVDNAHVSGLDLHPNATVHEKFYTPIIDGYLSKGVRAFPSDRKDMYYPNRVITIGFYSGNKEFSVGDTISTSGWRINGVRADNYTYANISSDCVFDTSDVDSTTAGTYPVHVIYSEGCVTHAIDVNVTVSESATPTKTLSSISATKTVTSTEAGTSVDTSDITTTATYSDGTSETVTPTSIDVSGVNTAQAGSYSISVSYTYGGVTKSATIAYTVTASASSDSGNWDDETVITQTWASNNVFPNTTIPRLESGNTYNFSFVVMSDVDTGKVTFQIQSVKETVTSLTAGQETTINMSFTPTNNVSASNGLKCYSTSGSNFPWTIKLKNFSCVAG